MVDVLPWILSALTVYMTVLAGNKNRMAWLVGIANQALWLVWILSVQAWGLIPMNVALWVAYARNHCKWSVEPGERITDLESRVSDLENPL